MSQNQPEKTTQSDTDSAPLVGEWSLGGFVNDPDLPQSVEVANVKCTTCGKATSQEFVKVIPLDMSLQAEPLETLKLAKRLSLCTNCGTLRLTN